MTQTIEYVVAVNATQAKGAIADVEKRFNGVTESAKGMAAKLGPAAAAISSVSASLGAAGGAAGKLVAAGGQVIAAFGAGGPIGAAIVAGTVAVDADLALVAAKVNDHVGVLALDVQLTAEPDDLANIACSYSHDCPLCSAAVKPQSSIDI
jgi:hypothetical protein